MDNNYYYYQNILEVLTTCLYERFFQSSKCVELGFVTGFQCWALWRGVKGGSSAPSYSHVVSNRFKKPMEAETESIERGKPENSKSQGKAKTQEEVRRKKRIAGDSQKYDPKSRLGPCKPKISITPRVVLSDPVLQAHREHMVNYVVIWEFMGLWPTEENLHTWIKIHWKPKVEIDFHLGSKGFFTIVFTNPEDKDRVFEGGP